MTPGHRRVALVGFGAAAVVAAVVLARHDPATSGLFPPCPSRALAGVWCPGCGALRAAHRLLHGEVAAAFRMNPLLVALAPLLAIGVAMDAAPRLLPRLRPERARRGSVVALWALVIGFGIARNLPWEPFVWLAPRTDPLRPDAARAAPSTPPAPHRSADLAAPRRPDLSLTALREVG